MLKEIISLGLFLFFVAIVCPYYFFTKIQSKKLKQLAIFYYVLCPFIIIATGVGLGGWVAVLSGLSMPSIIYFSIFLSSEKFNHSEIKSYARVICLSYAVSPILLSISAFCIAYSFNNEGGFMMAGISLSIVGVTISLALASYILFLIFSKTKNYKSIIALETHAISE